MYIQCIYGGGQHDHEDPEVGGNSLGLRIPKSLAEGAQVREGTTVDLALDKGRLIVRPTTGRTYQLKDLLAGVTRDNIHGEIPTGGPVGKEVW